MDIKVNEVQLQQLQQYKKEQFDLKKEVHSDIFPALLEGIRQIRELTQNIAIISGAIAAFTIPVITSPLVQIKILAFLAILFLFSTISYAVYHLTEIIPEEVNELAKQAHTYYAVLDESIDRVNKVISTGKIDELINFNEEEVKSRLNSLKSSPKPDKSLNRLRLLFFIALFLLLMSFTPVKFNLTHNISTELSMYLLAPIRFESLDLSNAFLGGIIGFILVFIVDWVKRPRINFIRFKKVKVNFGILYKIQIQVKGLSNPGFSQLSIHYNGSQVLAKWDENPNPLDKDDSNKFIPELVPETSTLYAFSNLHNFYEIPIIHEDTNKKLTIFCGWWFGRNKGYGPNLDINKKGEIQLSFNSDKINKKSKVYFVDEIIKKSFV